MRTLILTDIHANLPALKAVLMDAGEFERLVFLGDLANFGPHPAECVDLLRKYEPVCVIGNHDEQIVSMAPRNFWDLWAQNHLSSNQLEWISGFVPHLVIDGHILAIHGVYNVDYDILPNTPDWKIVDAFKDHVTPGIDEVWFGHYHYDIDRVINGIKYRCFRPVGHHRDKDTRASYYIYENGQLVHRKTKYDIQATINDIRNSDIFADQSLSNSFIELLENAYHEELLKKDIQAMRENELMNNLLLGGEYE